MKRVRWLSGLFLAGMLCVMLGTVGAQVAQAQREIYIFELNCVKRGSSIYWTTSKDVSIARQIYTSILTASPFGLTCRLPGGRASLRIEYGVSDQDSKPPAKIDVYVDGNQVASQVGKAGQVNSLLVDVSNGKSLAIDVSCSRATNCNDGYYYFFWFHVIPGASSPGRR